jgi:chemotaxis signal transduction protein
MMIQHIPEPAAVQPAESTLIVSFRLGSQQYSLPVAAVCEIVRLPALVTLVGASPALCGLLNLRGRFLPIFDGRLLMDEAANYDLSKQIVIVGRARPELGVIVDHVDGVVQRGGTRSAALPHRLLNRLIDSVCDGEHGAIIGISLTALLALADEVAPVAAARADS